MIKKAKDPIKNESAKFEKHLVDTGRRYTAGRQAILNEVIRAHGHFTAEELVKQCRDHNCKVSRATIYRSLLELREAGVIRETAFGDKHLHYEHVYDEKLHHHARCIRCHGFTEFPDLNEHERYHPILEKKGFKILGHEMHFYGICKNCQ